jgi:hypothetical protein
VPPSGALKPVPPVVPPAEMQFPLVPVQGVQLRMERAGSGERVLLIGPVVLALPLSGGSEQWLRGQLEGAGIVVAHSLPGDGKGAV